MVLNYLDGLLPEGNARVNHALTAGVPPSDTFALIREFGRDTLGAAIFTPAGTPNPTQSGRYEPLTDDEVAERLRKADEHQPASLARTTESSTLPGMVPKITLHRAESTWYACKDGAPSTWILKRADPPGADSSDVVDTEVASLVLARMLGLTSVEAEVLDFGDVRAIAVSRYDRDSDQARIHQEDLAQATGLNTQDPNRKFQWGSNMPALVQGASVLRLDGGNPDDLLRLTAFSFLVGNTDMHAKNISFLRPDDARVELSPAYDIAMHLHHPRDNRRSALDINGKYLMANLTIHDVVAEGTSWRIPAKRAERVVGQTTAALSDALRSIDRSAHPGVSSRAWDVVEKRTETALSLLAGSQGGSPDSGQSPAETPARTSGPRRRGPRQP